MEWNKELIGLPIIFLIFIIITISITGLRYNQWGMVQDNIIVLGLFFLTSLLILFI